MEPREYETMYLVEDGHWWYVGLRELVFASIHKCAPSGVRLLDAGCGTGAFLARCQGYQAKGFDLSERALEFCKRRGLSNVVKGSITDIPFEDGSFDVAVSFDVLCQVEAPEAEKALRELNRVLVKGGVLVLNLPAYEALRSTHDRAVHIRHRFTLPELRAKAGRGGFDVLQITYRNTLLFPVAVVGRMLKRFSPSGDARSDLSLPGPFINGLLTGVLSFENRLLQHTGLPFGLSVFCVLRKPS